MLLYCFNRTLIETYNNRIKWKPADENTVDFLLRQTFDKGVPTFYINLFHGNEGYKYHSEFELGEDASKIAPGELLDHRIIECKYDKNWPHFWRFSRFRDDKDAANHITTYVKVMESIEDNVTRKKVGYVL